MKNQLTLAVPFILDVVVHSDHRNHADQKRRRVYTKHESGLFPLSGMVQGTVWYKN